jgi:hypothetical protein
MDSGKMDGKTTQKRQTTTQKAILNYPKEYPKATREKLNNVCIDDFEYFCSVLQPSGKK